MVSPAQLYSGKSSLALVRMHGLPVRHWRLVAVALTSTDPLGKACRITAVVVGVAFGLTKSTYLHTFRVRPRAQRHGVWSHPRRRMEALGCAAPTNPMPCPTSYAAALRCVCV
jgi:hypothetical protein